MKKKFLKPNDVRFAFFGTPEIATVVLDELARAGFLPSLIVTRADSPSGRGKILTPPPAKVWAEKKNIPVIQPKKITLEVTAELARSEWDLFVVAAYGKILPQSLLNIPRCGTLNMHPSLLPRLRGPSPIRSATLTDEKETGVSIIILDAEMDHGPIVAQEKIKIMEWPPRASELEQALAHTGGTLLSKVLLPWVNGEIEAREQNHSKATFCTMTKKEDGLIDLANDPYKNLLKIRAFEGWPGTYTFFKRGTQTIRVQILDAHIGKDGSLIINTVRPEGKRDMQYADFLSSGAVPSAPLI